MKRLLPALTLSLCAGCATVGPGPGAGVRMTTDRMTYTGVEGGPGCRSLLRACLTQPPGMVNNIRMNGLRQAFITAVFRTNPTPADCDVAFTFPKTFNDSAEVFSAHTGEFLARFESSGYLYTAQAACRAFSDEDGPLFKKIGAPRVVRAAPAAAPAPAAPAAGGLSAADIERIAKAVRGAEAPAAAAAAAAPSLPLALPKYALPERPDDLAVVVGVETYSEIQTKAPYAERDAEAFKAHARALGVPERNIVLLTGAKAVKSALEKNLEVWLPRMAKPDSRVYVYFSGHGAPDVKTGQAYLVPWDGDPNFLEATAYPVARLTRKLGELPVDRVFVAMDSCFSGAGGRSVLATGARPLVTSVEAASVPAKVTLLTASAGNEISGSLDAREHGAFTWFLLEGLNGAAKDASGRVTARSLRDYVVPRVGDEARRLNRDQTPQLSGDDAVLR